jgi:hypothetical protein
MDHGSGAEERLSERPDNILDRLLKNHETEMEHLARRWNLGPLSQRFAEATPPKREGDPFSNLTVRYVFERGTITWRQDTGHVIERTTP